MADRVGQQLGNYRLIRLLGQGGFAEVYLGEHLHLGTQSAIKILHTRLTHNDVDKFRTEARTIARLVHPHIVRVFDFGIDGETPFLVMDYAPNGTIRKQYPKGVPLPLPTILSSVKQVADALQYAHDEHFIHRDIKPENLLIGRRKEILLSDFGIALIAQTSRSQSMQDVAGTASYMAPEQIQGKPRPASDQYALAIMVYEWLTGSCPFHGSFTEIASQHLFVPLPSLREKVPTIPLSVEQVVLTALAKDPRERFGSVQAFANALEQAWQSAQSHPTAPSHQAFLDKGIAPIMPATLTPVSETAFASPSVLPTRVPPTSNPGLPSTVLTPNSSTPAPSMLASDHNLPLITPPTRLASPSVDRQTIATWPPHVYGRTMLLVGLALLVIVGSVGLFSFIHANQVATTYANVTATSIAQANATATAQVVATATTLEQMYARLTSGTPVLDDPLSDNSTGNNWYVGTTIVGANVNIGKCFFAGGAYHVIANAGDFINCNPNLFSPLRNFAFQVQMTIIQGDAGGMQFRINQTGSYVFVIGQDGSYELYTYDGPLTTLQSGSSSAITTGLGQSNLVAVLVQGNTIDVYVNMHYVTSAVDNTYGTGYIGACAFSKGNPTEVEFHNAKVWTL